MYTIMMMIIILMMMLITNVTRFTKLNININDTEKMVQMMTLILIVMIRLNEMKEMMIVILMMIEKNLIEGFVICCQFSAACPEKHFILILNFDVRTLSGSFSKF